MCAIVLNGKELANKLEEKLKQKVADLKRKYIDNATLATIIVGNNPASQTYVKMKGNACERIGINSLKKELDETTTTQQLIDVIENLNKDVIIDSCKLTIWRLTKRASFSWKLLRRGPCLPLPPLYAMDPLNRRKARFCDLAP